jgi:hypothetical protein
MCERLFDVTLAPGILDAPPDMVPWLIRHFGSVETASHQTVVRVTNLLTLDEACFNPLRASRPADGDDSDDLETQIAAGLGPSDMFARPLAVTPADAFGRITGKHCVTASNVAKIDGWHGVVIFNEPHPLHFTPDQVADYLTTAYRWLEAAHRHDPIARYPLVGWNCLWPSGATRVHGHMQTTLSPRRPYAIVERWRAAAVRYRAEFGANYFEDQWRVYEALELGCYNRGSVRGYASLTPVRTRELVLTSPTWSDELGYAAGEILRVLVDELGARSFNLGLSLPPFGADQQGWEDLPCCLRIVERGDPTRRRVDVGYMELFGSSVVSADPFEVAQQISSLLAK